MVLPIQTSAVNSFTKDSSHSLKLTWENGPPPFGWQEVVSAPGLKNVEDDEYSESGRGVYPDGLYRMLLQFDERYKKYNMPFIITENGVSDATDIIRRPYIIEHLLAVRAAMDKVH